MILPFINFFSRSLLTSFLWKKNSFSFFLSFFFLLIFRFSFFIPFLFPFPALFLFLFPFFLSLFSFFIFFSFFVIIFQISFFRFLFFTFQLFTYFLSFFLIIFASRRTLVSRLGEWEDRINYSFTERVTWQTWFRREDTLHLQLTQRVQSNINIIVDIHVVSLVKVLILFGI